MTERRTYKFELVLNGRKVTEVIIDPHYELKHPEINDKLILEIVSTLDGLELEPEEKKGDWEFFMMDHIPYQEKQYRLVWCMKDEAFFLGVINCFRRK